GQVEGVDGVDTGGVDLREMARTDDETFTGPVGRRRHGGRSDTHRHPRYGGSGVRTPGEDQTIGFSVPARPMPAASAATSAMLVTAEIHQKHDADPAGTETTAGSGVTSAGRPVPTADAHD